MRPGRRLSILPLLAMLLSHAGAEEYSFDARHWTVSAAEHRFEDFNGRPAIFLSNGIAQLNDLMVQDAVIEFDVAFDETRGFSGVMFRMEDSRNFENFYLRPHQSGNIDATQYQPVFNGVSSWQLYHGSSYSAPVEYRYREWMPVKIIVAGDKAAFYVAAEAPIFSVHGLKRGISGGPIAINTSSFAPAWFSRIRVSEVPDDHEFDSPPERQESRDFIQTWRVSTPFSAESLGDRLQTAWYEGLTWRNLQADQNGVANIAELHGIADDRNTVLACTTLTADDKQLQKIDFGFSDEVTVFVNGKAVYAGSDIYQSRDYRYLGSIGLYDSVYMHLVEGDNDICFAISENFGGWGLVAALGTLPL